jgi:ubiquinone/menaquinone biosynthesis C-methylase UbiE
LPSLHIAKIAAETCDAGAEVFGVDLSARMIAVARQNNPDIRFEQQDMLALNLAANQVAGIVAFYAIVNIPQESLPLVFAEMHRVLRPGGLLLLAFHIGDQILRPEQLWGVPVSMAWFFFHTATISGLLEAAGFAIKEVIEREPYAPEIEHQSRRAYIFAIKPKTKVEKDPAKRKRND